MHRDALTILGHDGQPDQTIEVGSVWRDAPSGGYFAVCGFVCSRFDSGQQDVVLLRNYSGPKDLQMLEHPTHAVPAEGFFAVVPTAFGPRMRRAI